MIDTKGMRKKTCDKFGKAFLHVVALHERQERANNHENEAQAGAVDVDSSSYASVDERRF